MTLRDIHLQQTYDSGKAGINPVTDFFEPCLENSVAYDRLSGYFSSRVIALAAKGIGKFLSSSGQFRLVMSSQLNRTDFDRLQEVIASGQSFDYLFEKIDFGSRSMVDLFERKHFEAMCWLLSQGRLEIKVVMHVGEATRSEGDHVPIFHTKVGIFTDSNNDKVSFSGSVNETVAGWTGNIEEFKVFKSWDNSTKLFVEADVNTFDRYWNGDAGEFFETVELPEAIKRKLITQAPQDMPDLRTIYRDQKKIQNVIEFRDYQKSAIEAWVNAGMLGILEMATGTGKTKTAKGCIQKVLGLGSSCVLVTAPFDHIAKQWLNELSEFDPILISGTSKWRVDVRSARNNKVLDRRKNLVMVAVQNTAASKAFIDLLKEIVVQFDNSMIVGDEVHGLGATSFRNVMQPYYKYRLGLSATPQRYFDEDGTESLISYFGTTAFSFTTAEALAWRDPITGARALSPYKYFPIFVTLDDDELSEYLLLSDQIARIPRDHPDPSRQKRRSNLLFQRAAIAKTAKEKIPALQKIIDLKAESLEYCLIYCHDMEQLFKVGELLATVNIPYQKVTGEEGNKPETNYGGMSERDWILNQFAKSTTKVLLAIKCLDEGVDIPAARIGFVLASSGNPREFIQRRGRMLRPSEGKEYAEVYDFVVAPPDKHDDRVRSSGWLAIFEKELKRIEEFAEEALNFDQVRTTVAQKLLRLGDYG